MNRVELFGRITKDVELKKTPNGKPVTNFTLAVDRRTKDDGTDFINCVGWSKVAELMERYVHKGDQLGVSGHLQVRSYEKNGNTVYVTEVVVEEIDLVGGRKNERRGEDATINVNDKDLPF